MLNAALLLALAFAAERRAGAPRCGAAAAVDRYFPPHGAQQQTRRTPRLRSNDGTDRRTDGRSTVSQTLLNIHVQGG